MRNQRTPGSEDTTWNPNFPVLICCKSLMLLGNSYRVYKNIPRLLHIPELKTISMPADVLNAAGDHNYVKKWKKAKNLKAVNFSTMIS